MLENIQMSEVMRTIYGNVKSDNVTTNCCEDVKPKKIYFQYIIWTRIGIKDGI